MELLPGIHAIEFPIADEVWGTAYLLTGKEPALVDTGERSTPQDYIRPYLAQIGMSLEQITKIVLTHAHEDHAGGVRHLTEDPRIPVFAHPHVTRSVGSMSTAIPLAEEQVLTLGERQWEVIYAPGHSPGMICLYDRTARVLLASDSLQGCGTIDGIAIYDDLLRYRETIDRLARLPVERLLLSHPFEPSGGALLEGDSARGFFRHCRKCSDDYSVQITEIIKVHGGPSSLSDIVESMRQLHGCSSDTSLTSMTVTAHLKDLANAGMLVKESNRQGDFWSVRER